MASEISDRSPSKIKSVMSQRLQIVRRKGINRHAGERIQLLLIY
ncbi:hypothetical protein S7335_1503 [Synechococcus sp. PCC 7335]|nr:hypothetical protein S7335_1503 [Synechococcus sp. PCC 7335]